MKATGIICLVAGVLFSCTPSPNYQGSTRDTAIFTPPQLSEGRPILYQTDNLTIRQLSVHCYLHTSYLETDDFGKVPCNGMVVLNENKAVVFDTPAGNKGSEELIQFLSGTLHSQIEAVVATHFHEDCVGGLDVFHESDIPSYASGRTIALLKSRGNKHRDAIRQFDDRLTLEVGAETVEVRFFGEGHTSDNVIGYYAPDQAVFGGCLIKEVGAGKGNLEDANVHAWSQTVRIIQQQYRDVRVVVPGHGKPGGTELFDYTIQLFE